MSLVKRFIPLLLVLIVSITDSFCQEIRFRKINMATGLSHNSALCLLQDNDGYLWIGTRDGLNKYDGVEFTVYKHSFSDTTSISNNQINCIFSTDDNTVWIGTANGVSVYNRSLDIFKRIRLQANESKSNPQYVRSINEFNDSIILVGTTTGLCMVNEKNFRVTRLFVKPKIEDNSNTIIALFKDSKNRNWVGTRNGLYTFKNGKFTRHYLDAETESVENRFEIREIKEDPNGNLWICTENHGLYSTEFIDDQLRIKSCINQSNSDLVSNTVRKVFFNDNGNIWIGTLDGLSIYNPAQNKFTNYLYSPNYPEGISNNSIRDILKDSQGGIWVAFYAGGVNYYHPQNYLFLKKTHLERGKRNFRLKVVTAVAQDAKLNLWIGTEGDGLFYYNPREDVVIDYFNSENSGLINSNIKSLVTGDQGFLWIGTYDGLSRLDLANRRFKNYRYRQDSENTLKHNQVHALYRQNDGKIWIGTNGGGLQLFHPETESFQNIEGFEKNINSVFGDSRNQIWVGAQSGIYAFSATTHNPVDLQANLGEMVNKISYVNFVTEDADHNIWIGTQWNGLFLVSYNQLFWFNSSNGLNDNTVNALLQDSNDFWITTNKGISKVIFTHDTAGKPQIESKSFTISHGLQGLQFYPRSSAKLMNGDLLFGGINGYNRFNPSEVTDTDFHPPLIFTEFRLKYKKTTPLEKKSPIDKSINEITHLKLFNNQRDFSVFFTGVNFINPENTFYSYMVTDLDKTWIDLGRQRFINFTYFPIGTYELRIRASANPEDWGETYRSLMITVLPPWWKTWWAFLIYAFVLAAMLVVFFIYSQRWARMKNELEMEHFQREQEQALHNLKLKFFTDVSHELRTPLTLILAPLENLILNSDIPNRLRNQLTLIQRSGLRMMQMVNQILDLRKLEAGQERLAVANGDIIRFLKEISLAFKEIAALKNIAFNYTPHKASLNIWFDRDKLEVIINNLLSNAFKYTSGEGNVQLSTSEIKGNEIKNVPSKLDAEATYLRIDITDNGKGISQEDLQDIYKRFYSQKKNSNLNVPGAGVGLELTKRMIELHHGGISVQSRTEKHSENSGSVFSVYLPLHKEAYKKNEINTTFKNSEDFSLYTNELHKREVSLATHNNEPGVEIAQNGKTERLLIVEDNQEVRNFIVDYFADTYITETAENGEIGLNKAVKTIPDLIISDVMMPVMDGIELCRRIKTDIRTSHIPVVLLTARTALTFKYEGYETGADEYVTKPFSAKFLSLRVKNLIQQRKTIQHHYKLESLSNPGCETLSSIDEKLLKKVVDYVTENISDSSISVNTLSEHVGLSRVHFYRKIKALTNQTAVEFIRSIKLKRAALLLSQGKVSVKEVRNMVGFENGHYFRECFKKQYGVNPSEYSTANEAELSDSEAPVKV